MNKHKMQELQELAKKNGPLCVGLDTSPKYFPDNLIKEMGAGKCVLEYNKLLVKKITEQNLACCFKIQIAYYEAMGLEGMKIYADTLKAVKESGVIAISDIKRGDIAATADAYAKAHFTGDFETDIITVNPYMGFDTLKPFTSYAAPDFGGKGAFVLLCTSNPGMVDIEHQELKAGGLLLDRVGNELARIGEEFKADYPEQTCYPIGAVVGATQEKDARILRDRYPEMFFLIPGYGAQGGAARIAATLLDKAGGAVNSSRGILCAWQKDPDLAAKRDAGTVTLEDMVESAVKASKASKEELIAAAKEVNG